MKSKVGNSSPFERHAPHSVRCVSAAYAVGPWFSEKDEIGRFGSDRIVQRRFENRNGLFRQRNRSGRTVFCLAQSYGSAGQVNLIGSQQQNFSTPHARVKGNSYDPTEYPIQPSIGLL